MHRGRRSGAIAPLVGISLVVLGGFAALAIDLGFMYVKRSNLQTAADAAALAGANALVSFGNDLARIRSVAVDYGRRNLSADDAPTSALTTGDVVFLTNGAPGGASPNQVEVVVGRTGDRGNPLDLFLARIIGVSEADVTARARAEVVPSLSTRCLKPWSPPTKFTWDDACDKDKKYKNNGAYDPKSACEKSSLQVLGYGEADIGAQIALKTDAWAVAPGQFGDVDFPPAVHLGVPGNPEGTAAAYKANIEGCDSSNRFPVNVGDELSLNTGGSFGNSKSRVQDLISSDSGAHWDSSTKSIVGSAFSDPMQSPRVVLIAMYDPRKAPESGTKSTITVYQFAAFFIESLDSKGKGINGRFVRGLAVRPEAGTPATPGLAYAVRLTRATGGGS